MVSIFAKNIETWRMVIMSRDNGKIKLKEKIIDHIVGLIFSVILSLIFSIVGFIIMVYNMSNNINKLIETTTTLNERLTFIDGTSKESLLSRFNKLETHLNTKEKLPYEIESEVVTNETTTANYLKLDLTKIGFKTMDLSVSSNGNQKNHNLNWNTKSNDIIAKDSKTNKKYKSKNLVGKQILLPYKENNQEVYFLGQFNKNNHWHGTCIVNVYVKDKLKLINELEYDNGKLTKYKQVFSNNDTWIIGNRKPKNNSNIGYSLTYYKKKDYIKNFNFKTVEKDDIFDVDSYFSKVKKNGQEGYYSGETRNGLFNDKTGQAYLLKYNKNGKIRLFYSGNVKDGKQEDDTGNAWDIVLGKDGKYHYRESCYHNNKINYNMITYKEMGLSGEKAQDKLKKKIKKEFEKLEKKCNLNWA